MSQDVNKISILPRSIYRHLRRRYYKTFKPKYIKESIAKRKGKCLLCGCCEKPIKCKYLEGKLCIL